MYGVKVVSVVLLGVLLLCAGSCTPMQSHDRATDLLATGLVGWQQIDGPEEAWRFEEGVLYTRGPSGGWLATNRPYEDFVLAVEFRVSPGANSGIFLRAPLEGDPAYTGLEIQILDDYAEQWSHLEPFQYTGSIYDIQAPSDRVSGKARQWQRMSIIARGTRIRVDLNGTQIIDTDLTRYPHRVDTHPGLVRTNGYIGLQSHSDRVEFRKIQIREL